MPELTARSDRLSVVIGQASATRPKTRDPERVVQAVLATVLADLPTAIGCIYALPRGDKVIRGPSVRLAEILRHHWGGIWIEAVSVDEFDDHVQAKVVGVDSVTGNLTCEIVPERILDRYGRRYGIDGIINAKRSAFSKAKRNVILDLIPHSLVSARVVLRLRAALAARRAEIEAAYQEALGTLSRAFGLPQNQLLDQLSNKLGLPVKAPDSSGPSTDWMLTLIEYANAVEDCVAALPPAGAAPATPQAVGQEQSAPQEDRDVGESPSSSSSDAVSDAASGGLPFDESPQRVRPLRRR